MKKLNDQIEKNPLKNLAKHAELKTMLGKSELNQFGFFDADKTKENA